MVANILLEIRVKPEQAPEVVKTLQEMLIDTRKYDGCISVEAIQSRDDPGHFVLHQKWQSKDHYKKYSAWRAETGMAAAMQAKLAAEFSLKYFNPVDA
jgi:quinol monooxygenase YgiN